MINFFRNLNSVQKFTIISIATLAMIITAFSIYAIAHPSRDSADYITSQISTLATNYYEQYFFPSLSDSINTNSTSSIAEVLSEYTDTGFTEVPLRQVLLHTKPNTEITSAITKRCDENATLIHFFPDPPFTATSYHVAYDYSCNF